MLTLLYRWLVLPLTFITLSSLHQHPIFVSVTEIEHNAKDKTLEVSCKIFTDDFEKTLRAAYKVHVDLLNAKYKTDMDKLVNDYVQRHLKIAVNGSPVSLKYVGFENIEEGIYCYFQADNIAAVKKIAVTDNVLFEYKPEQISLLHVIVNGDRKSTKLNNPDDKAVMEF